MLKEKMVLSLEKYVLKTWEQVNVRRKRPAHWINSSLRIWSQALRLQH